MKRLKKVCLLCTAIASVSSAPDVFAGRIMDHIRSYDLNDYALGVAVSVSQNPYAGTDNSTIAYPYLTSFRDSAFTDDWIVLKEGNVGIRWVKNDWELGVLGRIQTMGFGDSKAPELAGLNKRQWGLEVAPMVGWRGWPVHVNLKTYTEITGHHDGLVSQLAFSWPQEWSWGYLIPSVELTQQSADYSNYYFGVSESEARPWRPQYDTGSTLNTALKLRWGYKLSDKWLLSGNLKMDYLDSSISASPIVEEEHLWSTTIGLAYNSQIFQGRNTEDSLNNDQRVELRIGVFSDTVSSTVSFEPDLHRPYSEVDLEEVLGLSDHESVLQLGAEIRLGTYHRIDFGYFEIDRSGSVILEDDATIKEEVFQSNTQLDTKLETKVFRTAYSYSLMRDSQKELSVMVGLHLSRFKLQAEADGTGQEVISNHSSPLPTLGLQGAIALGAKTTLNARAEVFRLAFDQYKGALTYLTIDVERDLGRNLSIGLAYNFYKMRLEAHDAEKGSFKIIHNGPSLFLSARF